MIQTSLTTTLFVFAILGMPYTESDDMISFIFYSFILLTVAFALFSIASRGAIGEDLSFDSIFKFFYLVYASSQLFCRPFPIFNCDRFFHWTQRIAGFLAVLLLLSGYPFLINDADKFFFFSISKFYHFINSFQNEIKELFFQFSFMLDNCII